MATKSMSDLFLKGKPVTITDEDGNTAEAFMRKPTPADEKVAMEMATAAKARVLLAFRDKDSDAYLAASMDAEGFSRDESIEYLIQEDLQKERMQINARLASEGDWAKEDYLKGLLHAWNEELKEEWMKDPEHEEALGVYLELRRFDALVEEEVEAARQDLIKSHEGVSEDELLDRMTKKMLAIKADSAWYEVYINTCVRLATRQATNHHEYHFKNAREYSDLPEEVLIELLAAYRDVVVDPAEGKESEETPTSSDSSE